MGLKKLLLFCGLFNFHIKKYIYIFQRIQESVSIMFFWNDYLKMEGPWLQKAM